MCGDPKRVDVQLLLSVGVPQDRIQELTSVSGRTIRRIGREPRSRLGRPACQSQAHRLSPPHRAARRAELYWSAEAYGISNATLIVTTVSTG